MKNKLFEKIGELLLKEQFRPSVFGLFINPFYFARRAIFINIKHYSENIKGKTLDIGCGSKPYVSLFHVKDYIGMDIDASGHEHNHSKIDVFYDGMKIPFDDNTFDSIVCFEVLEHVFNPEDFLKEAYRVLGHGGKALFTVPFIWDEHEQPYDFARYSSFGLQYLFTKSGFTVVEGKKYLCDLRLLALLINTYLYKIIKRQIPYKISFLFILPLTAISNILGCVFYLLPKNADLYFGNIYLLEK
jgi:SAM-dependent methyltransferase